MPRPWTCLILFSWLWILPSVHGESLNWQKILKKNDSWFKSKEAQQTLENILSHQTASGSWPKNIDTSAKPYQGDLKKRVGMFDNGATTGEMRVLARAFDQTQNKKYLASLIRAIDHVLQAQYKNGGWPQRFPPPKHYPRHITYNDDAMVNLMHLVRDIAESKSFEFVDAERRKAARRAFDRGVACILATQIKINGRLTAWCAQHDEITLKPSKARAYEHPSISGSESVGVIRLLMSLDKPSHEVVAAIEAACVYFEKVRLEGIRLEKKNGDRKVVQDPKAPSLWARFYEIKTNRPIFSGRDSVIRYRLSEIEHERRNGYSWYTTRPASLLEKDWPTWQKRVGKK